jgi:hypothetical protein
VKNGDIVENVRWLPVFIILDEHDRSGHARMRYTSFAVGGPVTPGFAGGAPCIDAFAADVTVELTVVVKPDRDLV